MECQLMNPFFSALLGGGIITAQTYKTAKGKKNNGQWSQGALS